MTDASDTNHAPQAEAPRQSWTTPTLRALSASSAENNVGGVAPDAEGTS